MEERSPAQAAERGASASSAASKRIADMEAWLGTALLHRHDRGVTPTMFILSPVHVIGLVVPWFLPETRGRPLPA